MIRLIRFTTPVTLCLGVLLGATLTLSIQYLFINPSNPRVQSQQQDHHHQNDNSRSNSKEPPNKRPRRSILRVLHITHDDSDSDNDESNKQLKEDIKIGFEGLIGNTPLVKIKSLSEELGCEILAKAEFMNPGGSPKDRVALSIIERAEMEGLLRPHSGDAVFEGTVGSTGVSLAHICRSRGYLAHICIPSDQSPEKSSQLRKLGAVVEAVPPASIVDTKQFVNLAKSRARAITQDPNTKAQGFFADQFENDANWQVHAKTTGPEIFRQCGGHLDAFVAGAGTGGTISGVARYLKPRVVGGIKIILADPQGSGLFNRVKYGVMFNESTEREGTRRRHQVDSIVEGIGINRVTRNFEAGRSLIDDAVRVTDEEAALMARYLVERDGLFVGSSSAVNCVAAVRTVKMNNWEGTGKRVVTVLCDSGTRHLSKFWKNIGDIGGKWDTTLQDVLEAKEVKEQ